MILEPGDALLFHGETAHYTPANVSNTRYVYNIIIIQGDSKPS